MSSSDLSVMALFSLIAVLVGSWVTHIIHCLMAAKYLLLIAGAVIPPVGIIHGIGIWFGASW